VQKIKAKLEAPVMHIMLLVTPKDVRRVFYTNLDVASRLFEIRVVEPIGAIADGILQDIL